MKSIKEYQLAYNSIIEILSENKDVLGVTVFGSIITGDIWHKSDIDMFIIVKDDAIIENNLFGEEMGIDVHMMLLSKTEFLDFKKNFVGGGKLHRKLVSSKLVIGKDMDVVDRYNYYKLLNDVDKDRWNLVYFGDLIRARGLCEKAINNGKIYNAIYSALKLAESISKIYLTLNGYLISSDPLTMAISLNDSLKDYVDRVLNNGNVSDIDNLINYTNNFLKENILEITNLLLKTLNKKEGLTINEIKVKREFANVNIEFDKILSELADVGIVKRDTRIHKTKNGFKLIEELTYCNENY